MPFIPFKKLPVLAIFMFLGVSACTVLGGSSAEATAMPIPTSSVPNMRVIPSQACQVAQQGMIRVAEPQGDLISWSPVEDTLAYIASTQSSSWNVGDLYILSSPKFDSPVRMATQVAGEISWAPDATSIAYLGFRRSDNLYTIGLAYPDGRPARDLFPDESARTDDYSSQKSILKWINSGSLRVLVSCGINCMQTMDFGVLSGLSTPVGNPVERNRDLWTPHTYHPSSIPSDYAELTGQLNWSWDEQHIAYVDKAGNPWVINVNDKTLYPLESSQYGSATETDWSYDNKYLAVQVDQNLKIFSFQCP